MPLNIVNITSLEGLNIEWNYLDASKTPPNSLFDCNNMEVLSDGVLATREGMPNVKNTLHYWIQHSDEIDTTSGNVRLFSEGNNKNYFLYLNDKIVSYDSNYNIVCGENSVLISISAIPNTPNTSEPSPNNCIYTYHTTSATFYTIASYPDVDSSYFKDFSTPGEQGDFFTKHNKVYFNCYKNGLYRSDNVANPTYGTYQNGFTKSMIGFIYGKLSVDNTTATFTSAPWFEVGKAIKVKAILKYYRDDNETFYDSPVYELLATLPYNEPKLKNYTNRTTIPIIDGIKIDVTNITDLSKCYLEIYRTKQFDIFSDVEEINYYQCYSVAVDNVYSSGYLYSNGNTIKIRLEANDDLIAIGNQLYTDSNKEGILSNNWLTPTAKSTTQFKNYTTYSNIKTSTYTKLTLINQPTDIIGDDLYFDDTDGTEHQIQKVTQGDTSTPYVFYEFSYEKTNLDTSFKNQDVSVVIRDKQSLPNGYQGVAEKEPNFYVLGTSVAFTYPSTVSLVITNINNYDIPNNITSGFIALARTVGLSGVLQIPYWFFFTSYTIDDSIPGQKTYNFEVGSNHSYLMPTAIGYSALLSGWIFAADTPTSVKIPLYPILKPYNLPPSLPGFSLVPLVTEQGELFSEPIGYAYGLQYDNSSYSTYKNPFLNFQYYGTLQKTAGDLLDLQVYKIQAVLHSDYNNRLLKFCIQKESSPGSFIVYRTDYAPIRMRIRKHQNLDNPEMKFDTAITTTAGSFTEISAKNEFKNGLIFSKYNQPEVTPIYNTFSPTKVGSENYDIIKTVVVGDQLYIFKDLEGIFVLNMSGKGVKIPLQGIDFDLKELTNNVYCLDANSIQVIDDVVYFLSNMGVCSITNDKITIISDKISTDIRKKFFGVKVFSTVSIPDKKYYLYSPVYNVCFVYNIRYGEWFKEDIKPITGTSNNERLTFLEYQPNATGSYPYLRAQESTSFRDATKQYDYSWTMVGDNYNSSSGVYTITDGATFDTQLTKHVARMPNAVWYWKNNNNYYPVIVIVNSSTTTVTFTNTADIQPNLTGFKLVAAVKSSLTLNRFFITGQGKQNQYSECQVQIPGNLKEVSCYFQTENSNATPNNMVFSGEKVTFSNTYDIIRVLIPRNAARGRWIMGKVEHSVPGEFLQVNGVSWLYRATPSTRNEK